MSRNHDELAECTLLGNQGTKYPADYAPEVLQTFPNSIPATTILSLSHARNSLRSAPKQGSPTSPEYL